jgi:hypothetical protein
MSMDLPLSLYPWYTSDGQHKEQQQQQCWEQQPRCQPTAATSAYSWASASYASINASDHVADHGQYASCSALGAAPATKG